VPSRVKSVVLIYKDEKYVGQIVNASADSIRPKGRTWILVKFNATLHAGDEAIIEVAYEHARDSLKFVKVIPLRLVPENR